MGCGSSLNPFGGGGGGMNPMSMFGGGGGGGGSSPLGKGGLLGGLGDALGTSSYSQTVNPNWYDPLGPTGFNAAGKPFYKPTGGVPLRDSIFGQFNSLQPTITANSNATADALRTGAANPGWAAAGKLATDQINGNYLHGSPELDSAMAKMRSTSNAETANNNSRIRSNFARNGMSFGTANQQAQEGNQALSTANADNAEAQARLSNYTNERNIQQQSPGMLDQSISQPTNYLAAIPNQYLAPLSQEAQVVSGLSSGGQIILPDTMVRQGKGTELLQGLGNL